MPNITYVVISCRRNEALVRAQQDACLAGETVHVESDEDDLDVRLRVGSTGTKMVRAFRRHALVDADWLCFIDDDCWVNAWALRRACSRLDPTRRFVATVGCMRTGLAKDSGGYRDVFGQAAFERVRDWWQSVSCIPSFTTFYSGGSGILVSKALAADIRDVCLDRSEHTRGLGALCEASLEHRGLLAALPQDKVLAVLVNMVRTTHPVKQVLMRGLTVRRPDGSPRWPRPMNDWEADGTGLTSRSKAGRNEKRICDFNLSMPKLEDGSFDYAKAVRLHYSNATPRPGHVSQHVVAGHANLVSWHGFKSVDRYELMQRHVESGREVGLWHE